MNDHSGMSSPQPEDPQLLYNQEYYQTYSSISGAPYERTETWLHFFGNVAEQIVRKIGPKTVLDAGCAKGFLVEALRDRGVEAFGADISEYAISQVREDLRSYCSTTSILAPFDREYDLIVCIEVLEHLTGFEAEKAVQNLCQHTRDILFSSTPDHFTELTHVNVQPMEHWAELFARQGFFRDLDCEVTFIAEHAGRFRKVRQTVDSAVRMYDRKLWQYGREARAQHTVNLELNRVNLELNRKLEGVLHRATPEKLRREEKLLRMERRLIVQEEQKRELSQTVERMNAQIVALREELGLIHGSLGWKFLARVKGAKEWWFPLRSRRRSWLELMIKALKVGAREGVEVAVKKCFHKLFVGKANKGKFQSGMPGVTYRMTRSWGYRVLLISGSHGDMERYRCDHTQEQLREHGLEADVMHVTDVGLLDRVADKDLVIFHRLPHSDFLEACMEKAKARQALMLYDIDDLVFAQDMVEEIPEFQRMSETEQAQFLEGARRHRKALECCDAAIVTTEYLVQAVARVGPLAWVHRNALSRQLMALSEKAFHTKHSHSEKIVIGYASGTPTHNRDFQAVQMALEEMLGRHPQVEVWAIGHLDLESSWAKWGDRVKRVPFVPWQELPQILAQLDINLAVLEANNSFCRSKSELKYFEAAAVGVPTVASNIGAFEYAIRSGDNGILVGPHEDWSGALETLITDAGLRVEMGNRARADALLRYHPATRGAELLVTLDQIVGKVARAN